MDVIQLWLNNVAYSHSNSKSTERNYRSYLEKFSLFIDKTPEEILKDYENINDERKFKRKYAMLVKAFISEHMNKYATCSIRTMVCAINSFFKYNDLPLGHVPMAKARITYHNRDITKDEIIAILGIASTRQRTFFCMMAQSGLRPYTLCLLKYKHIKEEIEKGTIPCKIDVPEDLAKGKYHGYFTFMGEESIRNLKLYFNSRGRIKPDDYLFTIRGANKKASKYSLSTLFADYIKKLSETNIVTFEQKQKGKPRTLRLYSLRKWFRKQAGHAGPDYVNFWMGHTLGVDDHYFSRDVEKHRKQYAKEAMPYLQLEKIPTIEKEEIEDLKAQLKKLQKDFKKMEHYFQLAVLHRNHDEYRRKEAEELEYQMRTDEESWRQHESEQAEKKARELVKEMKRKKGLTMNKEKLKECIEEVKRK